MSSSDGAKKLMHATPWALDELSMPDIFPASDGYVRRAESFGDAETHAHLAAERTHLEADAYQRGYHDAVMAAQVASDSELAATVCALHEAIASVELHAARWTANAEENIAALAVLVARHVILREVAVDASLVRDLVQRALEQFPIDQSIVVRLHPEDAATCTAAALSEGTTRIPDVRCVADPHIARGGCLVEGRERIIDGRIDTSLERAYRAIGQVQA